MANTEHHTPTHDYGQAQDMRDLYQRLGRTEVNVAALQSGLESLSRSTEAGFENLSSEIRAIANSVSSSRPNLGILATIILSTMAVAGALAGFALKATVGPLERDVNAIRTNILMNRNLSDEKMSLMFSPMDRRISDLERRLQIRTSDHDDRQDAEIKELQRKVFTP